MSTLKTPVPADSASRVARRSAGELRRPAWLAVAALALLAAVLRAIGLNADLWLDEIYAVVDMIRPPLSELVTRYPADTHHPLYSVFAHLIVALAGEHPWSVRLPAVLFGVATIPVLYALGRRIGGTVEGLAAAAVLAVSYHHVWFSQNARGYTALAFFASVCGYALLRGIDEGRLRWFALYAGCVALGAWTHLTLVFMAFGHAALCAWLMTRPGGRRIPDWRLPATAFIGGAALTVLLYLPMLSDVLWWFLHRPSNLLGVSTPSWALLEGLRVLALGLGVPVPVLLTAAVVPLAGVISYWRRDPVIVGVFLLPALATLAGALLARGTMYPRFFFFLAGFIVLIGVRGALVTGSWLGKRLLPRRLRQHAAIPGYVLVLLLALASARSLGYNYRFPKQDYSGAIAFVETGRRGETVVVAGVHYPFTTYHALDWSPVADTAAFAALRAGGEPFWVVYMMPRYVEKDAPGLVTAIDAACSERRTFHGTVGGGDIHACRVAPQPPPMERG